MSGSCTPGVGFPNASMMQTMATNHSVVWKEICMIQQAIIDASSQCNVAGAQMCVTVGGNTPMTFVSGIEEVSVINGGDGYVVDSPAVYFEPPIGVIPTVIATGTVTTNGGNILSVNITTAGEGYQPVSATLAVSSVSGVGANLEPLVNSVGEIAGVNIINGGTGYVLGDAVVATRAVAPNLAYTNAVFSITAVSLTGEILSIAVLIPGTGYQPSTTEVRIVSSLNPAMAYPLGAGFDGTVLTDSTGIITQVVVNDTGAGYSSFSPYLVISDPGSGATTSITLSGSSVSAVNVLSPGTSYTSTAIGTIFNPPTAPLPNPPASPALVNIATSINTYGTNPSLYWQVWAGAATNPQLQVQLNHVLSYFSKLGYAIKIKTNPATGSTISWQLTW